MIKEEKPASYSREQIQCRFLKNSRIPGLSNVTYVLISWTCLVMAVTFYLACAKNFKYTSSKQGHVESVVRPRNSSAECDLFKGQWVRDARGPLYTNDTCSTMQPSKNCFLQGRQDKDFLYWRWKPHQCELPHFDAREFLSIVRGKTIAFIGDSIARNQMESLVCLLSTSETPIQIYKDDEEAIPYKDAKDSVETTWKFQKYDFTVKSLWSKILVAHTKRIINGSYTGGFDLQLDKLHPRWSTILPSLDYAVMNTALWYFRPNYLYENGNLVGCTQCSEPGVTELGVDAAIRKVLRAAFKGINSCKNCKNLRVLSRAFSPQHYDGGGWNTGGRCNRTRPYKKEEVAYWGDLELRNLLAEEIDTARKEASENGNVSFDIIDITEMMLMRPDGHPNEHYGKFLDTGYRDCTHWCLPGPIDTWNQLLLEILRR